jgi:hypothetical protein
VACRRDEGHASSIAPAGLVDDRSLRAAADCPRVGSQCLMRPARRARSRELPSVTT